MPPNGNGHQNLIAQPGTSCPIEFRLIHFINGFVQTDDGETFRVKLSPDVRQRTVGLAEDSTFSLSGTATHKVATHGVACDLPTAASKSSQHCKLKWPIWPILLELQLDEVNCEPRPVPALARGCSAFGIVTPP